MCDRQNLKGKCALCGYNDLAECVVCSRPLADETDIKPLYNNMEEAYNKGYQQGREYEREKIKNILAKFPTANGYIDSAYLWQKWELLMEKKNE